MSALPTHCGPSERPRNPQLLLANARQQLMRMEETVLFALIERAQFRQNAAVYRRGAFPMLDPRESLTGYLLHVTEQAHAVLRRYTSPDELPFTDGLAAPLLPPLSYPENPLRPNAVNLNTAVRRQYETRIVPDLCQPGDDGQYGSCAVADVACLQALSRRIHYGKFIAEAKRLESPSRFETLIRAGDTAALLDAVTQTPIEERVMARVQRKASVTIAELRREGDAAAPDPERITGIYRDIIIPLCKEVQVAYLLAGT